MNKMALVLAPAVMMGCTQDPANVVPRDPETLTYLGAEVTKLDDEIVSLDVSIQGTNQPIDVVAYGDCIVSGYARANDFGFARHLRTKTDVRGGVISANAVYTLSKNLPSGLTTIAVADQIDICSELGIPIE